MIRRQFTDSALSDIAANDTNVLPFEAEGSSCDV